MTKPFIKAVVFDFGGVFTTSPVENFAAYERAHDLPQRFIGGVIKSRIDNGAFARFERAEITATEFDRAFAEETRRAGHEISGATLLTMLKLDLNNNMVEALKRVKSAGYLTGCITNNMPTMDSKSMTAGDSAEAVAEIFGMFDKVVESSKVGMRKPEPRIYELMCEALNVEPSACIFIDDLGVNLKAANALGMKAIRAPFGDVQPAIDELYSTLNL